MAGYDPELTQRYIDAGLTPEEMWAASLPEVWTGAPYGTSIQVANSFLGGAPAETSLSQTEAPQMASSPIADMLRKLAGQFFDPNYYLSQNTDVAAAGQDPYEHYVDFGAAEGRNPSQFFDTSDYENTYTDVAKAGVNPLLHFLQYGQNEGRKHFGNKTPMESGLFDSNYYLNNNPDVKAAGVDPYTHYLQYGASEGRNPSVFFNTNAYENAHPDIGDQNPLAYYATVGAPRGDDRFGGPTAKEALAGLDALQAKSIIGNDVGQSTIDEILGRRSSADDYVRNLLARNLITDAGASKATSSIDTRYDALKSLLNTTRTNLLNSGRSQLNDRFAAERSRIPLATSQGNYSPDEFSNSLGSLNESFLSGLNASLTGAAGNNPFPTSGLGGTAGQQGSPTGSGSSTTSGSSIPSGPPERRTRRVNTNVMF